jgi:hypothetical protein
LLAPHWQILFPLFRFRFPWFPFPNGIICLSNSICPFCFMAQSPAAAELLQIGLGQQLANLLWSSNGRQCPNSSKLREFTFFAWNGGTKLLALNEEIK